MASEWPTVTIGDVAKIKHGFAFKSEFFTDEVTPNVLVTPGNFAIGGGFQVGKPKYYAGPLPDDYVLSEGAVVVTMTDLSKASDTLGYAAKVSVTPGVTYWHNQRIGLLQVKDEQRVCKDWLHYLMRTYEYRAWIVGSASGTTVKHTAPSRIESFAFRLPPLEGQFTVAETLGALDDRIENLRQTNATLQAIAAALFKSWFVDFDGVPPEDMQESELGLIPKGWRTFTFGEIATLGKGSVSPAAQPQTVFRHYSLPAFDADQMPIAETGEAIKSNKTPVPFGAVLVSKLNPHIPRIWFVGEAGENAVCSTEFLVWTPKPGIGSAFVYFVATSPEFNASMRQLVTGTSNSHQRVRPDQLADAHAAIASKESIASFDEAAAPLLRKIEHNRQQAAALANLRDALLPRLISGQLRLPHADRLAGTVT